jgi:ubiquinone/menaquinone biosynthesis C-methylase UbiE
VGDARYLPFRDNFFDTAFSYSVLIHFSHKNVGLVLKSLKQVLKPGGISKIHLSNIFGLRSLYARSVMQKFKKPTGFEVRYWTPGSMYKQFNELIGPSILEVGSYFSQGQISDLHLFCWYHRMIIISSEILKKISHKIPFLKWFADNILVVSRKI